MSLFLKWCSSGLKKGKKLIVYPLLQRPLHHWASIILKMYDCSLWSIHPCFKATLCTWASLMLQLNCDIIAKGYSMWTWSNCLNKNTDTNMRFPGGFLIINLFGHICQHVSAVYKWRSGAECSFKTNPRTNRCFPNNNTITRLLTWHVPLGWGCPFKQMLSFDGSL